MALVPQTIPIVLSGALSQKTDAKLALPGKMLVLENARRIKQGRFDKRLGYDQLSTDTSGDYDALQNALALSTFNDDLILTTDEKLYSWSPSSNLWIEKSNVTSVTASVAPYLRNSAEQSEVDAAINHGVQVAAYTDSRGGVWAVVSDRDTGAFLLTETQLNASGSKPTVRACGNYIYVFYIVAQTLRVRRLNPLAATAFDSEVSLVTDVHASNKHYDVAVYNAAMIVAYNNTTPAVKVLYCMQAPAVGSPVYGFPDPVVLSETAQNCISVTVASGAFFIAYHNGTNGTRAVVLNADLTEKYASQTLDATTSPVTQNITGTYNAVAGDVAYFYEVHAAAVVNTYVKLASVSTGGVVVSGAVLLRSIGLASQALTYNGRAYVAVVYDSSLQGTAFLIRDDGMINAKFNAGLAGGLFTGRHLPQAMTGDSADVFTIPCLIKSALIAENAGLFTLRGLAFCTVEFQSRSTFQNAQLGGTLHFATGVLQAYDGFSSVEHGFHLYPEGVVAAVQAGGSIPVGTRAYKVIYSWVDNQGQVHRSAPSVAVEATTSGGNQQVQLTIPTLRLTARRGVRTNATIEVYGTTSSPPGILYYKLTSTSSPLYNDPTVDTVTYVDAVNDNITSNEPLYTTGDILDNVSPPSSSLIAVWKNRLVLAGNGDNTFCLSKPFTKGEAIAFSDDNSLVRPIDSTGGDCTAVGVLDDKLILFRPTSAYAVAGDGPNNAGQQSTLSEPIKIQMDVGCPYPNSVVATPDGLMFKSLKGIYVLTSALKPVYIGADVEDYNDLTVESAVLVENANEVRFSTVEGTTLVYNYLFQEWGVHSGLSSVDAVNWQGRYTLLRTESRVWREANHYRDNGQHIPLRLGPGWLSLAGLQGFQRAYRLLGLGDYKTAHKLKISVAYDFEPVFTQVGYFDTETGLQISDNLYGVQSPYGTEKYGGPGSGVLQFRVHLKRQKCESIRFVVEDVPTGDPDEAFNFSAFSLQAGVKKGAYKLPARKSL